MQIDWFTFVAQIINFLILIALLQRFLYKPVIKAMDEREKKITSELEEARQKKVQAEQKENELEHNLKDFELQKTRMLDEAQQKVSQQQKEWMDQLRLEISEIRKRWIEAVESEKNAFLMHLTEETGEQLIGLIKKVLSDLSERNLQQQTADFLLDKLHHLSEEEKNKIKETVKQLNTTEAEIVSSFELESQHKHQLRDLLLQLAGKELECNFKTTGKLGFGLEVRIGGWRLGWNLESYLQQLKVQMNRFFSEETPMRESSE